MNQLLVSLGICETTSENKKFRPVKLLILSETDNQYSYPAVNKMKTITV